MTGSPDQGGTQGGIHDEIDATTIAEYRRVLEEAAAELGERGQRVAGATAAVLAALGRLDHERRELRAIARDLAGVSLPPGASADLAALVERARRLVAR